MLLSVAWPGERGEGMCVLSVGVRTHGEGWLAALVGGLAAEAASCACRCHGFSALQKLSRFSTGFGRRKIPLLSYSIAGCLGGPDDAN